MKVTELDVETHFSPYLKPTDRVRRDRSAIYFQKSRHTAGTKSNYFHCAAGFSFTTEA